MEWTTTMSINGFGGSGEGLHIKALIPIGIQGLLDDTGRVFVPDPL